MREFDRGMNINTIVLHRQSKTAKSLTLYADDTEVGQKTGPQNGSRTTDALRSKHRAARSRQSQIDPEENGSVVDDGTGVIQGAPEHSRHMETGLLLPDFALPPGAPMNSKLPRILTTYCPLKPGELNATC